MKKHLGGLVTLALAVVAAAAIAAGPAAKSPSGADAFQKMKSLEGEWEAKTSWGPTFTSYRVVSKGTAIYENATGSDKSKTEMMSVYHLDGDKLVMTHFCGQGNQPRMRAETIEPNRVVFKTYDVTNLASPKAGHMSGATFTFKDADHFTSEWTNVDNGKESKIVFEFVRVK